MRILGILLVAVFLNLAAAFASTVNLSNGSSIQGEILKRDNKSLQINVDGVTMTYYADEIKDIDGSPFVTSSTPSEAPRAAAPAVIAKPPVAQAPAPVVQAQENPNPETVSAPATVDPDKKALILKFIEVFGTRQALTNNFELMIQQIEKEKPDEAQKIRERVKVDEIIERLLPIYDRNFSSEDLNAFIAFYGSPKGQKLIGTIPELMKESVQESVKYMEEKFPEVKQGQ